MISSPDYPSPSSPMTQVRLHEVIRTYCGNGEIEANVMTFRHEEVELVVISDEQHDRMRIIAPVCEAQELEIEHIQGVMEANFHSALDARYAVGNGILYSAFIHPLSKLDQEQVESAVRQVATLQRTFGEAYTSGELEFPG